MQTTPSSESPAILLVDDEPLILRILQRLLSIEVPALPIHTATTGLEALTISQRAPIALAFIDYHLIDISGDLLASALRRQSPDIQIVLCSGEFAQAVGDWSPWDATLHKPFTQAELRSILRATLGELASKV